MIPRHILDGVVRRAIVAMNDERSITGVMVADRVIRSFPAAKAMRGDIKRIAAFELMAQLHPRAVRRVMRQQLRTGKPLTGIEENADAAWIRSRQRN